MAQREPASIRYKNPGAQWPGPVSKKFGSTKHVVLKDGQGNKIAVFDTFEAGGAAQFYLWATRYTGMTLESAIKKWSGHNSSKAYAAHMKKRVGISMSDRMTKEYLASPDGWKFMKAQAHWEAGKAYPMTDKQWQAAQKLAFGNAPEEPKIDPLPEAEAGVQNNAKVWHVQRRLSAMNYNPGTVDGLWGGRTGGVITAFINDRGLKIAAPTNQAMFDKIHDALVEQIAKAEGEGFTRPIAPERAEATEETVAEKAPEIVPVKRGRFMSFITWVGSLVLAFITAMADYFKDALSWVVGLKGAAADAPAWIWFIAAAVVALAIWFAAKNGANGIVESFRKGDRA